MSMRGGGNRILLFHVLRILSRVNVYKISESKQNINPRKGFKPSKVILPHNNQLLRLHYFVFLKQIHKICSRSNA